MSKKSNWPYGIVKTAWILGPLVFAFAFALDIYIPTIPQLLRIFHTSESHIQLTLSLFLFFSGVGQLLFGPLSDQFGRIRITLLSIVLFLVGTLWCALSVSVFSLIIGRIIEAVGACGTMVCGYAIVRDVFDGVEMAKVYSYLNGFISISPLFAPVIGGYLDEYFGWRSVFIGLLFIGVLCLVMTLGFVKETLPASKRYPIHWNTFSHYGEVFKNAQFLAYFLCSAVGICVFFTFFSTSPYILIQLLHVPADHFGFYFGMLGVVLLAGSLIGAKIVEHVGIYKTTLLGALLVLVGGLVMWASYGVFGLTIVGFVLPFAISGLGSALMVGSASAGAMAPFPNRAGVASAALGFGRFGLSAVNGSILMLWRVNSTVPLSINYILLGVISLGILLVGAKKLRAS